MLNPDQLAEQIASIDRMAERFQADLLLKARRRANRMILVVGAFCAVLGFVVALWVTR